MKAPTHFLAAPPIERVRRWLPGAVADMDDPVVGYAA
jgi:hypothetical protein